MKKTIKVVILLTLVSCSSKKQVVYMQDIDETTLEIVDSVYSNPSIQVNDVLDIRLSALNSAALSPFSFSGSSASGNAGVGANNSEYVVNIEGVINFPVIGELKLTGLSIDEAQNLIADSLQRYVNNPIVQVRISNFKFTVLGGVSQPGTYSIGMAPINLLQAIGLAGDFSINGKRENVLLIRENNGKRNNYRVDFTDSDWLNSELFYIQQNDVIYIEPNYSEIKSAGMVGDFNELLRVITVTISTYLLFTR